MKDFKRTWLEIDLDALAYNYQTLSKLNAPAKILGIVKADAYGLGAIEIARKFEKLGARYLAVAALSEAVELRSAGITAPILILGYTPVEHAAFMAENDITQGVSSLELAREYSSYAEGASKPLTVHLKLDTGMGRLGFIVNGSFTQRSIAEIEEAMRLPNLRWEGVFTHFAVSDSEKENDIDYTHQQYDAFKNTIAAIESDLGMKFELKHCSNSGASDSYTEFHNDMIRPGISMYGVESFNKDVRLKPIYKLKTVLGPIRPFPEGNTVSYGRLWTAPRESRVGILPIGYADGLDRRLSGQLSVMTPYGPAPVVGRICMDMCMIDLTEIPEARTGDEIEIIGEYNSAVEIAKKLDTISYVVSCGISRRVPRLYFEDGKLISTVDYLK